MLGHEKEEWGHLGTKLQLRRFIENILWPGVNFIELDKFYLVRYIDIQAVYVHTCIHLDQLSGVEREQHSN